MCDSIQVLIVDDDVSIQRILMVYMNSLGFQADSANSGIEALQKVHQKRYTLILMDIQMPGMGGLEATTAIRMYEKSKWLEPVPIIAITAGGATRQECFDTGMNEYLSKPVSLETLQEVVSHWIPAH